jgi:uncharacterized membrane protein SpoIIM required for sporulation
MLLLKLLSILLMAILSVIVAAVTDAAVAVLVTSVPADLFLLWLLPSLNKSELCLCIDSRFD